MDMTEWQQHKTTVCERDMYLLEHEMFYDCHFAVGKGDEIEKFSSHRLYLAKTSSYFAAMFYGPMKKKGNAVIKLPDVSPDVFRILLKYVYSGNIELSNFEKTWEILLIAKMYLFPDPLLSQLRSYLWNHIYPDKLWETVELANAFEESELMNTAWQLIKEKTSDALKDDYFVHIPMTVLQSFVTQNSLSCTEIEIFNHCLLWANNEAEKQEISNEPANLRTILEPVIPHIRVLAMKSKDIVEYVKTSGIFTRDEMFPMLTNTLVEDADEVPKTICSTSTPRSKPKQDNFFVFGTSRDLAITTGENYNEQNTSNFFVFADISFSKAKSIVGIEVPSQVKELKTDETDVYVENLTVLVLDHESKKILVKQTFQEEVKYNSIIEIPFITLHKTPNATTKFSFKVIFHVSGLYPFNRRECYKDPMSITEKFQAYETAVKYYRPKFWYIHSIVIAR